MISNQTVQPAKQRSCRITQCHNSLMKTLLIHVIRYILIEFQIFKTKYAIHVFKFVPLLNFALPHFISIQSNKIIVFDLLQEMHLDFIYTQFHNKIKIIIIIIIIILIIILCVKINMWLAAPKGATSVNQTSATDQQMTARQYNVISITLHRVY